MDNMVGHDVFESRNARLHKDRVINYAVESKTII